MVFKALDRKTGNVVALKCMAKNSSANGFFNGLAVDEHSEELEIHRRIGSHPNIVNLLNSFETENHMYLVLEFCSSGDLYEAIRLGRGPLETEHVREFMLQLVEAVEHLHSKGIYHRDIKPENIFLVQHTTKRNPGDVFGLFSRWSSAPKFQVKLGDFGLATTDTWSTEVAVGSDRYMAPEQYDPDTMYWNGGLTTPADEFSAFGIKTTRKTGYSPPQADIWALGICLLNILFQRNPFAVPNVSDPLFADFARDKETLFDVFPNMSNDTFGILIHCLALDPSRRSLAAVKEAIKRVVSFTTDDEVFDDFCSGSAPKVAPVATANREPLRTPSITTPAVDSSGAFPWAMHLATTSPQQVRRELSTIPEPFPSESWVDVTKPDNASFVSFQDSGLGVSLDSNKSDSPSFRNFTKTKPVAITGAVPSSAPRLTSTLSSLFKKSDKVVSKSWSELWDEEEEELSQGEMSDTEIFSDSTTPQIASPTPAGSVKRFADDESDGRSTPRGLAELNLASVHNSRKRSPEGRLPVDNHVSEHTGFMFEEDHAPKFSPPSKGYLQKWAALGDFRRNLVSSTPNKSASPSKSATPTRSLTPIKSRIFTPTKAKKASANISTPQSAPKVNSTRKRSRAASWRRPEGWTQQTNDSGFFENNKKTNNMYANKEWNRSKDWRRHDHDDQQHSYDTTSEWVRNQYTTV